MYRALDGDDAEAVRWRKAASQMKYTCPGCGLNAWAKAGVNLVCGECGRAMEAEAADDIEPEAD
jgi:uncharacterized Zn finger protein (UPF0148 family)